MGVAEELKLECGGGSNHGAKMSEPSVKADVGLGQ